jgi:hypothetical protein
MFQLFPWFPFYLWLHGLGFWLWIPWHFSFMFSSTLFIFVHPFCFALNGAISFSSPLWSFHPGFVWHGRLVVIPFVSIMVFHLSLEGWISWALGDQVHLWWFLLGDWEEFNVEHLLRAQELMVALPTNWAPLVLVSFLGVVHVFPPFVDLGRV